MNKQEPMKNRRASRRGSTGQLTGSTLQVSHSSLETPLMVESVARRRRQQRRGSVDVSKKNEAAQQVDAIEAVRSSETKKAPSRRRRSRRGSLGQMENDNAAPPPRNDTFNKSNHSSRRVSLRRSSISLDQTSIHTNSSRSSLRRSSTSFGNDSNDSLSSLSVRQRRTIRRSSTSFGNDSNDSNDSLSNVSVRQRRRISLDTRQKLFPSNPPRITAETRQKLFPSNAPSDSFNKDEVPVADDKDDFGFALHGFLLDLPDLEKAPDEEEPSIKAAATKSPRRRSRQSKNATVRLNCEPLRLNQDVLKF